MLGLVQILKANDFVVLELMDELMWQKLQVIPVKATSLRMICDLIRAKQFLTLLNLGQSDVFFVGDVAVVHLVVLLVLADVFVVVDSAALNVLVEQLIVIEVIPHSLCNWRADISPV